MPTVLAMDLGSFCAFIAKDSDLVHASFGEATFGEFSRVIFRRGGAENSWIVTKKQTLKHSRVCISAQCSSNLLASMHKRISKRLHVLYYEPPTFRTS